MLSVVFIIYTSLKKKERKKKENNNQTQVVLIGIICNRNIQQFVVAKVAKGVSVVASEKITQ